MKKDYSISCIRGIATLLVVGIHIAQRLSLTYPRASLISDWGNIGLVMFFVISAFLYSKRRIEKPVIWFAKRYFEIAIPSIIVVVLFLIIYQMIVGGLYFERIINAILSGLGFEEFVSDPWMFVQLWYLSYILICYLSVPFIQKIKFEKPNELLFWGGIILITIALQALSSLPEILLKTNVPLSWAQFVRFFFPYAVFRRYSIDSKRLRKIMMLLSGLSIITIALTCYLRYIIIPKGTMASVAELLFIYTKTLCGFVLFYWLYLLFGKIKHNVRLCDFSDKYSYPVYLTHCLFIMYNTSIINRFNNTVVGVIVALICTAIASWFVELITTPVKKRIIYLLK